MVGFVLFLQWDIWLYPEGDPKTFSCATRRSSTNLDITLRNDARDWQDSIQKGDCSRWCSFIAIGNAGLRWCKRNTDLCMHICTIRTYQWWALMSIGLLKNKTCSKRPITSSCRTLSVTSQHTHWWNCPACLQKLLPISHTVHWQPDNSVLDHQRSEILEAMGTK